MLKLSHPLFVLVYPLLTFRGKQPQMNDKRGFYSETTEDQYLIPWGAVTGMGSGWKRVTSDIWADDEAAFDDMHLPLPLVPASSLCVCSGLEQMRPVLAGPPLHQGVREAAGEERGRKASSGLHPEEAGGDVLRPGEESTALDPSWPATVRWSDRTFRSLCLWEEGVHDPQNSR